MIIRVGWAEACIAGGSAGNAAGRRPGGGIGVHRSRILGIPVRVVFTSPPGDS